jgi:hypothetical protein
MDAIEVGGRLYSLCAYVAGWRAMPVLDGPRFEPARAALDVPFIRVQLQKLRLGLPTAGPRPQRARRSEV